MEFEVTVLGSNSAIPAHGRHPSAQILNFHGRHFLLDCGEGTQIRLAELGMRPGKIEAVLITHLHGDHYFGLAGLLNTFHLLRRNRKLTVYCPAELPEILQPQVSYFKGQLSFELEFVALKPGQQALLFQDDSLQIESLPLQHGRCPASGFLIRERSLKRRVLGDKAEALGIAHEDMPRLQAGEDVLDSEGRLVPNTELTLAPWPARSYAYCTDTAFDPALVERIRGVNLLYHEATYAEQDLDRATRRNHSTARQAATVARDAGVDRLLIGHFSSRYEDLEPLLLEARSVFPQTELAREGESFAVERKV